MAGSVANPGDGAAGAPSGGPGAGRAESPLAILLPEPSLVVLVGAAGAGKSTLARAWFRPEEILASDDLRALLAGDPGDQSATRAAFSLLHRRLTARLRAGRLTVVDATNVRASARRPLVRRAAAAGVPAAAIVLDLPPALIHARNLGRAGRVVPAEVVDRQLADVRATVAKPSLAGEGFATTHRISDPAVLDSLVIRRMADALVDR